MELRDFMNKYHISCKDIADKVGVSAQRIWVLTKGGCHRSMVKYAPIIESMAVNCKDKIYIPPLEDESIHHKRVEKIPFSPEEVKLAEENPYRVPFRTFIKIRNGHLFSKKIHDRLVAQLKGEISPKVSNEKDSRI